MTAYTGMDSHVEWPTAELAGLLASGVITGQDRVLDLGAGLGTEAIFLARHGCSVVAIENEAAARTALRRRVETVHAVAARLKVVRGDQPDATRFRELEPGGFDVVIDRLLLHNLRGQMALDVVSTMAHALRAGGLLILRNRRDDAEGRRDMIDGWGRVTPRRSFMSTRLRRALARYFDLGDEVGFAGLITDPTQSSGALVVSALPMSILIGRRNTMPLPAPRSRRPGARRPSR